MKTRPRDQGTWYETQRVSYHQACGLYASRLIEGAAKDLGDLAIVAHPDFDPHGAHWIEEAKFRANLNPHKALDQAIHKAGHKQVLLAHKRLTRNDGNQRRTPDGLPEIVATHPTTAEVLLATYEELRGTDPKLVSDIWKELDQ